MFWERWRLRKQSEQHGGGATASGRDPIYLHVGKTLGTLPISICLPTERGTKLLWFVFSSPRHKQLKAREVYFSSWFLRAQLRVFGSWFWGCRDRAS